MTNSHSIRELNEQLAQKINDEVRVNPQSPYTGKFVGIANGQVVVVADDWNDVGRQLEQAERDSARTFCFEAGEDSSAVEEIWELD